MERFVKYKRAVMFVLGLTALAAHTGIFWYVWEVFYSDRIGPTFYRRGHWLVVAIYAVLLYTFTRIYGGYKVGSLRVSELIYSQVLALFFTNVLTYCQVSLIGRYFVWPIPLLLMTLAQLSLIILWAYGANLVYYRVFPPRKMIMVYGSKSATRLVYKMSKRYDKYLICAAVDVAQGYDEVIRQISPYSAVVLCDVKSEMRNKLLKYCFDRDIRVYLTPKLSQYGAFV